MVSPLRANKHDTRADDELAHFLRDPAGPRRPRCVGQLRLPITLTARPWASLYELHDGARFWCVRLWDIDRPVRRCFTTGSLVAFARLNGLNALRAE
ncbi:MAG: hypothetical protein L3J91_05125, partial [Thermoplasmata archaeon]|nr:hypothetical protein [Thermoplasmata archaeon]